MQHAPTELDRAKAEVLLACYWARVGEMATAQEIRQRSRSKYPSGVYGEVTILHMCLDGIIHYYSEQSPSAADRLRSAHALASTYKFRNEQAFSAAWLAHVEFNRDHWESMFDALQSCHAALNNTDKATQGRLSLVVADALTHSGEDSFARAWYEHARTLLTSIGDHAAIEAFLYNGAALRLHAARLRSISENIAESELTRLGGDIASATNYQRITQQKSLDYLLAAANASHRILAGDFAAARDILQSLLSGGQIPAASSAPPLLLADLALCISRLDDKQSARTAIAAAAIAITDVLAADDLAIAAHSLASACQAADLAKDASRWLSRCEDSVRKFADVQRTLRSGMSRWMAEPAKVLAATS
jgi:hypothetical protein